MFIRRLAAVILLAVIVLPFTITPAPVRAQGPAVEFLMDQMRQRDGQRQQAIQRLRERPDRAFRERRAVRERTQRTAPAYSGTTTRRPAADVATTRAPAAEISDQAPRVVELPKLETARRLLVVGDEMAEGLAEGLRDAFAGDPSVRVEPIIRAGAGLIDRETVDWVAVAREALRGQQPLAIVFMAGNNDRRPIADGGTFVDIRSDRWRELYAQRLDEVIRALSAGRAPVYVVGLPAMREQTVASEAAFLNDLFKARAFASNARFVDTWEGFVDEDGRYVAIGPDVNGNTRRLRRPDGIALTPAGNRKLAFFVETELRRDLNISEPAIATVPQPSGEPSPEPTPQVAQPGETGPPPPYVGPVIVLTPASAQRGATLGGAEAAPGAGEDLATRVLVRGDSLPARPGRADDFRWPPEDRIALPGVEPEPRRVGGLEPDARAASLR